MKGIEQKSYLITIKSSKTHFHVSAIVKIKINPCSLMVKVLKIVTIVLHHSYILFKKLLVRISEWLMHSKNVNTCNTRNSENSIEKTYLQTKNVSRKRTDRVLRIR